jgi:voltage-gated potassium channel
MRLPNVHHARVNRQLLLGAGALLGFLYGLATTAYMRFEHHTLGDAAWWAFMTFTTVGYGDQYPHTGIGRLAAVVLVFSAVFVIVPVVTAVIVSTIVSDQDEWTHDEQEEVKYLLRELAKREGIDEYTAC